MDTQTNERMNDLQQRIRDPGGFETSDAAQLEQHISVRARQIAPGKSFNCYRIVHLTPCVLDQSPRTWADSATPTLAACGSKDWGRGEPMYRTVYLFYSSWQSSYLVVAAVLAVYQLLSTQYQGRHMSSNGQPWQHLKESSNPPYIFQNLIHQFNGSFLFPSSLAEFVPPIPIRIYHLVHGKYRYGLPDCSMLFLPVRRQTSLAIGYSSVCLPRRKQSPEDGEPWQQVSTPCPSFFAKKLCGFLGFSS